MWSFWRTALQMDCQVNQWPVLLLHVSVGGANQSWGTIGMHLRVRRGLALLTDSYMSVCVCTIIKLNIPSLSVQTHVIHAVTDGKPCHMVE